MIFIAYSKKELPRVGPPVGSLVRIDKKWVGRIEEVFLDGVRLTHMIKRNNKFVATKHKVWEEPFSAISAII
tara:strand:- start:241 stop:456 length:216 start_codon:yes stop_codon:yes gene_type:complete